jgi:hypothetical protein
LFVTVLEAMTDVALAAMEINLFLHEAPTLTTQCRVSMQCHGPTLAPEKLRAQPTHLTVVLQLSMKCGVALQVTVVIVRKPLPGTLRENLTRV